MMSGVLARLRSFWRGLRERRALEAEMSEEFGLHIGLRAQDLERSGLAPAAALRHARREFGSTERYKAEARAARGLRRVDELRFSWLDFKLGFRMLVKYPGLTLVGGLALAFAILVGAVVFEFVTKVVHPSLPLDEGDRVVGVRLWHRASSSVEEQALFDYARWRGQVKTIEDLGAFRTQQRNLITSGEGGESVVLAEISASAFRLARVAPLLGRPLLDADEQPGAPAVLVIGYDVWQRRFAGASDVLGRRVRLGAEEATIVGVMPERFSFPVSHNGWVPLSLTFLQAAPREGPAVSILGRLAPGVSPQEAQAELAALGVRTAADHPLTHEHVLPQVLPYARSIMNLDDMFSLFLYSINGFVVLFVLLVCANVALLLFARAATRESEIVVRTSLGASRGRIITQLFSEALVLGAVSALAGLMAARLGLRWLLHALQTEGIVTEGGRLPFWITTDLWPETWLYCAGLTVLSALVAGVLPALKVTRAISTRLRQVGAGGGGLQFGGVWTVVIVVQVAFTVMSPVMAFFVRRDALQLGSVDVGFAEHEYLAVRLELDRHNRPDEADDSARAALLARFRTAQQELLRRLASEGAVSGVTFAERLPRMYHPRRFIEVNDGGSAPRDVRWPAYPVTGAEVDANFFSVLGIPIGAGRGFHSGGEAGQASVVVNESFVELVLGGRNAIGRRIRYLPLEESGNLLPDQEPGPWLEIVGVVRDLGTAAQDDPKRAGVYHPAAAGQIHPAYLAVHVRGDPLTFAPRLRALASAADPALRLEEPVRMSRLNDADLVFLAFWFKVTLLVSGLVLLLSLSGIYAVTSFAVSRRTREIGIRIALGANTRRVIAATFARPLRQVGLGVVAGGLLAAGFSTMILGARVWPRGVIAVAAYAVLMMLVCMLACIVPTRRALRVQPSEALRQE